MKLKTINILAMPLVILLVASCSKKMPSDEELNKYCQDPFQARAALSRYEKYSEKDKKIIYERCQEILKKSLDDSLKEIDKGFRGVLKSLPTASTEATDNNNNNTDDNDNDNE